MFLKGDVHNTSTFSNFYIIIIIIIIKICLH